MIRPSLLDPERPGRVHARLWTPHNNHDLAQGIRSALISYEQTQQAIGRADTKASLAVTAIGALLGFLLSQPFPTDLAGRPIFVAGIGLLLLALTLAGAAVYPRLSRHTVRHDHDGLFWGEIALNWKPGDLASHLARQDQAEHLEALTRQLVTVSRLSVRKHRFLQASLLTSLAAILDLTAAYLIT
jgi:hypothetical protein